MLAERDKQILDTIVDIYVREGEPVSSQRIKRAAGLSISTATIRNVMARLEMTGYLMKPHTSAGRVPTDEGYRSYVDRLDSTKRYESVFSRRFRSELKDQSVDISTIMASASRILGGLSKNLAVVYGSIVQESVVDRLHLVDLGADRLLVVVKLRPEYERTVVLRMEKRFGARVIANAEEWINRSVAGRSPLEAKGELDAAIRDNVTDEGIIAREVAVHREDIFSEPPEVEFYFEEREYLLGRPEFSDPRLLQLLLRLLRDKTYLTSILSERMGERTQVTIGAENRAEELQPFSLVTAGYRMGIARGVLGIIGPTRMRYDLNQDLVGSAARELGAIGEEFF